MTPRWPARGAVYVGTALIDENSSIPLRRRPTDVSGVTARPIPPDFSPDPKSRCDN